MLLAWRGRDRADWQGVRALLESFLRHPGVVLSREALVEHCWDFAHEPRSNIIDAHIHSLRDKIDRQFGINSLETVRGVGYRIRADGGHPG